MPNSDQRIDSYIYTLNVRDGVELFHPHHLVYNFFGYVLYKLFKFTDLGSLELLSIANSFLGAFTLTLIFMIIRSRISTTIAIMGTLTIGFLYSFWYYSTSVEVNMPGLLFLCLALYFLLVKPQTKKNSIAVFIFLSVGILFYQVLVLAVIPILVYEINRFRSFSKVSTYALPILIVTMLIYLVVAIIETPEKNLNGIYKWLTLYSHFGWWGKLQASNFIKGLWGLTKTVFGGDNLRNIFYDGMLSSSKLIYVILIIITSLGLIWLTITAFWQFWQKRDCLQWLLLSLALIFGVFAIWWAPSIDDFWFYPVVLILIFAFRETGKKYYGEKMAFAVLILILIMNTFYEFVPGTQKKNSIVLQGATALNRLNLTPDDLVLTNFNQIRLALDYHYGKKIPTACLVFLESGDKDVVISNYHERIKENLSRGKVMIFGDEISPEPHRRYLFERFSPDDYSNIYGPFFPYLVPMDSIMVYGKNVVIYQISQEVIYSSEPTLE